MNEMNKINNNVKINYDDTIELVGSSHRYRIYSDELAPRLRQLRRVTLNPLPFTRPLSRTPRRSSLVHEKSTR